MVSDNSCYEETTALDVIHPGYFPGMYSERLLVYIYSLFILVAVIEFHFIIPEVIMAH